MRTCCGIVRDTSSPVMATIREPFRITSGIEISATRFDIRNCRRHGSRTFGGIRQITPARYVSPKRCLGLRAPPCAWLLAHLLSISPFYDQQIQPAVQIVENVVHEVPCFVFNREWPRSTSSSRRSGTNHDGRVPKMIAACAAS